jgi:hypothetical protein
MGVLSESEVRFNEERQSSKFGEAWRALKVRQPLLSHFREPEDLRDFCRNPSIPYEDQDPLVFALCIEARREAEDKVERRFATDLLSWIFLPALLNVGEQASAAGILSQWEAEAEILSGFWEMAIRKHRTAEGLSGRLVNAGRHQVWRSIRGMAKEGDSDLDALEDQEALPKPSDRVWADPWMFLCWAQLQGTIPEAHAELIFWTRLHGEPLRKICELLGIGYKAGQARRYRAEKKLADWYSRLSAAYPPTDPKLARECIELARKPSELARKLGRSRVSKWPPDVLEE